MPDTQEFDFRAFHASHKIAMIVACSENGVIGVDGDLPWRLPTDLRHFMRSTKGCSVIMGRKTFESLDKPLPNRLNIVLSRSMSDDRDDGVRVASSIEEGIAIAEASEMALPIWIAGGGHIYRQAMGQAGLVDLIVRTRVHTLIKGDAVFPEIDPSRWKLAQSEEFASDDRHVFGMTMEWWVRNCVQIDL
ncbi:hypothetical protein COB72_02495 [bacterium]|nr:MAG: hypothetical protein COB72_02495 [bacterium]